MNSNLLFLPQSERRLRYSRRSRRSGPLPHDSPYGTGDSQVFTIHGHNCNVILIKIIQPYRQQQSVAVDGFTR